MSQKRGDDNLGWSGGQVWLNLGRQVWFICVPGAARFSTCLERLTSLVSAWCWMSMSLLGIHSELFRGEGSQYLPHTLSLSRNKQTKTKKVGGERSNPANTACRGSIHGYICFCKFSAGLFKVFQNEEILLSISRGPIHTLGMCSVFFLQRTPRLVHVSHSTHPPPEGGAGPACLHLLRTVQGRHSTRTQGWRRPHAHVHLE